MYKTKMHSLTINTGPNIKLHFSDPRFTEDGWLEKYRINIESSGMSANLTIENPPYGNSPYVLFEEMADNWKGWQGNKTWASMEGEYSLSAIFSSTGHISLTVELEVYNQWSSLVILDIEAGQLNTLAEKAKLFFGC